MSTTTALIQRLDAVDAAPGAAELRTYSYELLRLRPGDTVVDVGCGSGRAVSELAAHAVVPIGVDPDQRMLDVARTRWPAMDFRLGTAESLPLPEGSVAAYRADKVFHEIADPATALTEAKRVLTRNGRIVLLGQDWEALIIDADDLATTRTIVHARAATITNPRSARAYRNLLVTNGFQDVTIEARTPVLTEDFTLPMLTDLAATAVTTSRLDRDRAEAWTEDQTTRAREGRLLVALPLFIAAATLP